MNEKRRVVINTLFNGMAQFAAMASALVFMPFLIKAFGMNDYGLYILAGSVSSYAALLDFGVGTSLTKMVAEKAANDEHETIGELASTALTFYIVIGLVLAAVLATLGLYSNLLFHVDAEGARLLRVLFFTSAAFSVWAWPAATATYILAGKQKYHITASVGVGVTLGNILAILLVLLTHKGPFALLLMSGFVGVAGTLVNIWFARRELHGVKISPLRSRIPALKSIFMFSWSIFVVQVATVIVYQQTDRLVIGIFLGAAAVTLYEAAGKFQGFIVQLIGFATSAVLPMASKLDAEGRSSALHTLYFRGSKYTVALISPVVVVLLVFAKSLIVRWLGPAFAGQAIAAQIMVLPQLFMCTATLGDSIIIAQGKLPERLPYVIAVTVGNLVLSLALVKPLGILGVVLGTTIPYVIDYPFHVRLQLKQVGVSFKDWLRNIVAPTYPLLAVPLLVAWLFTFTPLMSRVAGVGLAGVVAVFSYWGALYFLGMSASERGEIRSALGGIRKRFARG